jgi:hypothetical protein
LIVKLFVHKFIHQLQADVRRKNAERHLYVFVVSGKVHCGDASFYPDKESEIDEAVLIISLLFTGFLLLAGLRLLAIMVLEKKVITLKNIMSFRKK